MMKKLIVRCEQIHSGLNSALKISNFGKEAYNFDNENTGERVNNKDP